MAPESLPEVRPENAVFVVLHPHRDEHLATLEQRTRDRGSVMGDPDWTIRNEESRRLYAQRLEQVLQGMANRPAPGVDANSLLFAEPSPHSGGTHYPVLGTPAAREALRRHLGREGVLVQMGELFDGIVLADGTRLSDGYRGQFAAICESRAQGGQAEEEQLPEPGQGDILPIPVERITRPSPPKPRPIVRAVAE